MRFQWRYEGDSPRKLRTVLREQGVTNSLIKVTIYHGGAMYIGDQQAWAIDEVQPGQVVSLVVPNETGNEKIDPYPPEFRIAYEDRDYLIINKDAGVATVPAHHVSVQDSLVNQVKAYYQEQNYPNQVTHVATRLDRDTSGLVVFPKHRFAHAVLDRQLKKRQVKKDYVAVVSGCLQADHVYIDAPIQRDPESFVQRIVGPAGKVSVTEYWVEKRLADRSLIRIRLHTGRTHQIRVHLAYLHHPLLGDEMYGGPLDLIGRQALHCHRISFWSPFKQKMITCTAPLPADIQQLID
ncbi:RluA family pseudouridine synthase [Limosilactobacillus secaliphilus]|uniref:Pseudouridine synthase n=1 Tax=Limosilactobacillus secaliphilus TaxID=396268 RepID=A0A0R2I0J5_9LACO|nr:RluA family pseudouridine synthase [Limosilactobacillus secaliphilus]KRN58675.1 pseudouridine synthase [Limosilactobacillus secaliphilus]